MSLRSPSRAPATSRTSRVNAQESGTVAREAAGRCGDNNWMAQPLRPPGKRSLAEHRQPRNWPPDDITAVTADIDAGRDLAGRAPHTGGVLQQQMKAAGAGAMYAA